MRLSQLKQNLMAKATLCTAIKLKETILNYSLKLYLDKQISKDEYNTPLQGVEFCKYKGYAKYSINCLN